MATTYSSSKVASGVQARAGNDITAVYAEYEIGAALVINDVIQMVKVPAGATILDVALSIDDLDSGSTGALKLEVGIGGSGLTDIFITAQDAKATGLFRMNNIEGHLKKFTAEDTIDILVDTAPETGATAGTLKLSAIYTMAQ